MAWCNIHGHDRVVDQFRKAIQSRRLASTFLFVGPPGIGKRSFAIKLAQALQCAEHDDSTLNACGECESCKQIAASSHPDVEYVNKPKDRSFIPLDTFIGDKEHRMRTGLCHWIGLKPAYGKRKVAIIDDADFLNQEGANCLLKTLEEPPPRSVLILIGTSQQRQLPTIRSRCQIVRFDALDADFIANHLVAEGIASDMKHAHRMALDADGSIDRAIEWSDEGLTEFREELIQGLCGAKVDSQWLAKMIAKFVEAAGKDNTSKRARLRQVIELTLSHLQACLNAKVGITLPNSKTAAGTWSFGVETTALQIDRCIEADRQVMSNANIATLIDCWVDDLLHGQPVD